MNKTMALIIKFIATFVAGWLTLGLIDGNRFGGLLTFAVAGTILNYIIGDLMVLPAFGNIVASIGDGILGAATAYVIDLLSDNFDTRLSTLAILAVVIAIVEYFFHKYLVRKDVVEPSDKA